jgi:predicted transcriptional regulator
MSKSITCRLVVPAFGACVASTLLVDWMVDVEAGATAEAELAVTDAEGGPAVLVAKAGQVLGVLTRSDLLEFLAHRRQTP